ncbi:hypothetical protein [Photorhabdus bodei]|uniref:hypothetical protein n=1 Tax=Photorhabdus bodei TaxID=2029681 RepID=UPI001EFC9B83|nr:hypothetical protein [Photorhabdus bodei]
MSTIEHGLSLVDILVFMFYVAIIISVGLWVSRNKKDQTKALKITSWQVNLYLGGQ